MRRLWCKLSVQLLALALLAAYCSAAELPSPSEVKADFLKLLDRPRVSLDPREAAPPTTSDGLVTESWSIASETLHDGKTERVPMLVVRPEKHSGKLAAIIVLHGTGGSKDGMKRQLTSLATAGFLAVAIDARYHGQRAGGASGSAAYNQAVIRAWRAKANDHQEHPFLFDTCWDIWRTVDYLTTRADVDPQRIGMVGISMGGMEAWLAAACDERVRVVVPIISAQSFRWSLENEAWQGRARTIAAAHEAARADLGEQKLNARVCRELWSKVVPGILDEFDCPSMLRLLAGRPTLLLNGELDQNCPLPGAELAFASARQAFAQAGATDKLKIDVATGSGHTVTSAHWQMTVEWFEKWLAP